jgi:class 3 adenylate cyclase
MTACVTCGSPLPEDARFCPSCGSPTTLPTAGQERKVVTVLFADVTGSTALGERLDPERFREVMQSYGNAMREEIEAEGGTVEKFIGDAVMAAFGVPAAHEDDPERALRASLRMMRRLDELNGDLERRHDVSLQIRVGINTGEVLAATNPGPGEAMVTGDAVNAASRLQGVADPGEIFVSQRTADAVRGFSFEDRGVHELKGKRDRVRAVRLVEETGIGSRGVPGLSAPMVGRTSELDLLRSVYDRAVRERRPHLVTVYGEAGVGKSRLTAEFLRWAESTDPPPTVLRGRCLPYGDGITYWPLAEILKGHAGILDSDPPELAVEKVRKTGRRPPSRTRWDSRTRRCRSRTPTRVRSGTSSMRPGGRSSRHSGRAFPSSSSSRTSIGPTPCSSISSTSSPSTSRARSSSSVRLGRT